jgi:hypothetical protein
MICWLRRQRWYVVSCLCIATSDVGISLILLIILLLLLKIEHELSMTSWWKVSTLTNFKVWSPNFDVRWVPIDDHPGGIIVSHGAHTPPAYIIRTPLPHSAVIVLMSHLLPQWALLHIHHDIDLLVIIFTVIEDLLLRLSTSQGENLLLFRVLRNMDGAIIPRLKVLGHVDILQLEVLWGLDWTLQIHLQVKSFRIRAHTWSICILIMDRLVSSCSLKLWDRELVLGRGVALASGPKAWGRQEIWSPIEILDS